MLPPSTLCQSAGTSTIPQSYPLVPVMFKWVHRITNFPKVTDRTAQPCLWNRTLQPALWNSNFILQNNGMKRKIKQNNEIVFWTSKWPNPPHLLLKSQMKMRRKSCSLKMNADLLCWQAGRNCYHQLFTSSGFFSSLIK